MKLGAITCKRKINSFSAFNLGNYGCNSAEMLIT